MQVRVQACPQHRLSDFTSPVSLLHPYLSLKEDELNASELQLAAAHSAAQQRKQQAQAKRNLRAPGPLRDSGGSRLTDTQYLTRCKELLDVLPKQSAYAKHRRRVIEKAMQLLDAGAARSSTEGAELQRLLKQLSLM